MILPTIEDYIEILAGYKSVPNKTPNPIFNLAAYPDFKLAAYDVNFMYSVSDRTLYHSEALTVKQAELASRLISVYARQLAKHGIEQPDHKNYRKPLRTVEYVKCVSKDGNNLLFKFPFDEKMIADLKNFAKDSQGNATWLFEKKVWIIELSEYNLSWVVGYADLCNIPVMPDVRELFNLILEAENKPHKIELNIDDAGNFFVENAPFSMQEYIDENLDLSDPIVMVDSAGVLCYTVNDDLSVAMKNAYGPQFMRLCKHREIEYDPSKGKLEDILSWAEQTKRFPIVVYNHNASKIDLPCYIDRYGEEAVMIKVNHPKDQPIDLLPTTKVVYTNIPLPSWEGRLPLLITHHNLMHGKSKIDFQMSAEKIVFFCQSLPRK
jgi:hypothetical protein